MLYGTGGGIFGTVRFTSANVLVMTASTILLALVVERTGPTNLATTVSHRLVAASTTATPGIDFEYTPGSLTWAAGDAASRNIIVRILEDSLDEPTEFVRVELFGPSVGTAIASPSHRTIQIGDDDEPSPSSFSDGFESGDTSAWSATVP